MVPYELLFHRYKAILQDITFLGFKFELKPLGGPGSAYPSDNRDAVLQITYQAYDNDLSDKKVSTVAFQQTLPLFDDTKRFIDLVFNVAVLKVLTHEAGELFIIKGERPFNEHNTEHSSAILSRMFPFEEHWKPYERDNLHHNKARSYHR